MKKIFSVLFVTAITSLGFAAGHTVTVSGIGVSCFGGNDGSATAMVSGGSGSYSYAWTPSGGTGVTESGLTAGSYTVTVTDLSDMSVANASVIINQPNQLILNVVSNPVSCGGSCDGSASVMPVGGSAPYTYSWSPSGIQMQAVNNLCAGTYTVTVVDMNGCMATQGVVVSQNGNGPMTGVVLTDSIYNETCLASGDGAVDITLSGSNPGPFTYQWNNGQTTQDAVGLESNLYTVVIYDANMYCLTQSFQVQADGVNCGGIDGKVYVDMNTDCAMNGSDIGLSNILITTTPGNYYAYTNASGDYHFANLPYGTYSLSQQISNPYISENYYCPGPANATINGTTPFLNNINFSDTAANTGAPDVSVIGYLSALRPGFPSSISLVLNNNTILPASGVIKTSLPAGYGALITSASPSGYIVNGDSISWNFSNINYGSASFNVYFTVPFTAILGTTQTCCAFATVTGGDVDLTNNSNCFSRTVMGSFDPNDKSVSPEGVGAEGNITLAENELTYMIRFQNTGNAEAINITVLDTLSSKLDITSLNVIAASHNYNLDVMDGNVLRFKFDNIMLVDSNTNEPASHGCILYKVKQSASNVIGDVINNTAYIYFDFNSPVVTNTTVNTIQAPLGIQEFTSNGSVTVYPNPFSENTTFMIAKDKNETYIFELRDVLGKVVNHFSTNEKQFSISRDGLNNGMYFYSITNNEGVVGKGKLIIK